MHQASYEGLAARWSDGCRTYVGSSVGLMSDLSRTSWRVWRGIDQGTLAGGFRPRLSYRTSLFRAIGSRQPGARVGGGVDLLELGDGDVGVALGAGEAGVAEKGLDVAHVGAAVEHVGGAGVAQQVGGPRLVDTGARLGPAHRVGDPLGRDRLAPVGDEQRVAGVAEQAGPALDEIAVEPGRRALAQAMNRRSAMRRPRTVSAL